MKEGQKQAVSLRLGPGEIRKIKKLAKRLGVRDSDIIRYALKVQLSRLSLLCDPTVRGRDLMPVFVDSGVELLQYFELDEETLERIINDGAEPAERVAQDDLQLMSMVGMQRGFAKLSLRELQNSAAPGSMPGEFMAGIDDTLSASFRQHLYSKYVKPQPPRNLSRRATDKKPVT